MTTLRKVFIVLCLLAVAAVAWVWWSRPERVDMAAYVPADTLIYLEADSLPDILAAYTSTDAWRALAPREGVKSGGAGWLSRLAVLTGVGRGETVVFARAQVAVAVLGFDATEEPEATLKFSPRAALVAETHTSEWRARPVLEKLVGDFAQKTFGAVSVERKEVDGDAFVTWAEQSGSKRRIIASVSGGVAVVGNDEAAVRACLEAKRGARPSLSGVAQLGEMRARIEAGGALAFGFAPKGSAAKIFEVLAPVFVGGITQKPEAQSIMAAELPRLINQTVLGVGWSSRLVGGSIEDRYFVSLPEDVTARLQPAFATAAPGEGGGALALVPAGAYQVSAYNFRNPDLAWRGTNAALSARVDVSRAPFVTFGLEALVKPYGVEKPVEFLRACGPELVTARLGVESEGKVLAASARDEAALRKLVREHLGARARAERVGDAELFVSAEAEPGAAAFLAGYLLTGSEEDVRACLAARAENRSFGGPRGPGAAAGSIFDGSHFVRTLTDDSESARAVLARFGRRVDEGGAGGQSTSDLSRGGYSVSETRLAEDGIEKRTRSSFGLLGDLFARLAPGR